MTGGGIALGSLERLLDGLDDVIVCGLDDEGRILHTNRSCEKVTGVERNSLLGQRWIEIFAQAERQESIQGLWAQTAPGVVTGPFEALCRNERRIQWRFAHWKLEELSRDGLCAYGYDVTRDREALARARAAERTVAVAQLSAGLAHEIRNPLNSAKLQLDLAERRIGSADLDRAAGAVRLASNEVMRASALLTDFLAFARPPKVNLGPADLRRLIVEVKQRVTTKSAAVVDVQIEPGPTPIIDADDELVAMAVEHLVANAVDAAATNPGGGQVVVRVRFEENCARVEVEDNGPGLSSPEAPVFDAFFTTKPNSTGLGLAIVQRVAFDHGGSISYGRREDRTVFTLRLPIVYGGSAPRG
jgi:PAS domain S-box-containing protein